MGTAPVEQKAPEIPIRRILNRWNDAVLWEGAAETIKDAIHAAYAAGANLRGANLGDADLRGADLGDANLGGADLRDANLGDANLRGANLGGADLRGADLGDADLRGANLRDANLGGANLRGANLGDANLRDANLGGANLRGANLGDANLRGANLGGADLRGADLGDADLRGANLRDANLGGANLRGANLGDANLGDAVDLRLPTGETWDEYLTVVVPALLVAGGKSLESYREHWDCHTWENCPMAHGFNAPDLGTVPALLRPRADQFIQFFDGKQIPWSVVQAAIDQQAPPAEAR